MNRRGSNVKTTIMTVVIATAISTIIAAVPAQAQTFYSITEISIAQPYAINEATQIVGDSGNIWSNGTTSSLGHLGGGIH